MGGGGVVCFVHCINNFSTLKKAGICDTQGHATTHTIPRRTPRWEPLSSVRRFRVPASAYVGDQPGRRSGGRVPRPGLTSRGTARERSGVGVEPFPATEPLSF